MCSLCDAANNNKTKTFSEERERTHDDLEGAENSHRPLFVYRVRVADRNGYYYYPRNRNNNYRYFNGK